MMQAAPVGETRPPTARLELGLVSGAVTVLLLVTSGGYGYHRDELYFIRAGSEPAF